MSGAAAERTGSDDVLEYGAAWAALVQRLAHNLDRGGRQWTGARRKDSLQRVLAGSKRDPQRLLLRLQSLMTAWEGDEPADFADTGLDDPHVAPQMPVAAARAVIESDPGSAEWSPVLAALQGTVAAGLPATQPHAEQLAVQLAGIAERLALDGVTPAHVVTVQTLCEQARRLLVHRHHLVDELAELCRELGAGLTDLAEDGTWARGQCESLQARLADGPSVRSVRAAAALLADTRAQQHRVRNQRLASRDALRQLIHDMVQQVGELGADTGRFESATAAHAEAIESADSLESLAGVVKAMLADTRAVQTAVSQSHEKLQADQNKAANLEAQVRQLESEMRRLSDEVSTDALTQVANRRGLMQAFEAESARCLRDAAAGGAGATLAVALIDIDNFKKLNDSLGHAAGDRALKALAAGVRERLRPVDHLARFGGEEFVVLLPGTLLDAAQQTLSRLQRNLTQALFLHEGREVFVTFSAGVTAWRPGEELQAALERADEAMYEAKRTGKNRTCTA
ncbi:MAG: diguanylate cyclase [Pseudomonadota bacterium]|nr:diguanylate cyclase [Pseudomonadota bacterium]